VLGSQRFTIFRAERIDSLIVDVPGDSDLDGIADFVDNCPDHPNVDQTDSNGDDFGDTCAAALGFPVPEPASDFVLAAGCVTLAMLGRLRRARSTS
jgi:hypothetical protein